MATTFNPDRKQRFTEAYSDALAVLIPSTPKFIFGIQDIPDLVKMKLAKIAKAPTKFDIEVKVMEMTCGSLGIEQTRDEVFKFLEGEPTKRQELTPEEIEVAIGAKLTELTSGDQMLAPEALCAIMAPLFPSYSFTNVQDEIIIEAKACLVSV